MLGQTPTDMTIFFRKLAEIEPNSTDHSVLLDAYYGLDNVSQDYWAKLKSWLERYRFILKLESRETEEKRKAMNSVNPKYILRNYIAQQVIDKLHEQDVSELKRVQELIKRPYDEQPEMQEYAKKRPEWASNKPGCSALSCSS